MGDYDRKPMEPPSQWLRLKSKGDEVRFRIAGRPLRELKVWPAEQGGKPLDTDVTRDLTPGQWFNIMSNPDWSVSEVFHFLVIDRSDNTAKIFTTTGGVYGKIRDYATNPEWGNPMGYDLTVKRTEAPGKNYYEVTPSPNKSELMKSDLAKVDALDTSKLLASARPASDPQPDDFPKEISRERLPWEPWAERETTAAPAPTPQPGANDKEFDNLLNQQDNSTNDLGDEPVNLDDIPF